MDSRDGEGTVSKPISVGGQIDKSIIQAISEATGQPPSSIPPLGQSLDFQTMHRLTVDGDPSAVDEFEHAECTVRIESDAVIVEPQ